MIDEKFIAEQKRLIEKAIKRLEGEIKEKKKYLEIGTSNEDNALEFEAFEERSVLNKSAQKDLKELKEALHRIEKGKYGICTIGGEEIERGRLKAYPSATTCVSHAKIR